MFYKCAELKKVKVPCMTPGCKGVSAVKIPCNEELPKGFRKRCAMCQQRISVYDDLGGSTLRLNLHR